MFTQKGNKDAAKANDLAPSMMTDSATPHHLFKVGPFGFLASWASRSTMKSSL